MTPLTSKQKNSYNYIYNHKYYIISPFSLSTFVYFFTKYLRDILVLVGATIGRPFFA